MTAIPKLFKFSWFTMSLSGSKGICVSTAVGIKDGSTWLGCGVREGRNVRVGGKGVFVIVPVGVTV